LEIWNSAWDYIQQRPVLGYGAASGGTFAQSWTFPHSLYLSTWYYSGIIGLILVISLFATLLYGALRIPDTANRGFVLSLLSVPAVAGITDLGQAIKPPSEEWYIIWLPVIIASASTMAFGTGHLTSASLPHVRKRDGVF
jgi:O-antigen ligase